MAFKDIFDAIGFLKEAGPLMLRRFVATHRGATYAELRFEASFSPLSFSQRWRAARQLRSGKRCGWT